jgi:hypothetical protein
MTKSKIPFGWWPGHWGLTGKTRERAQAEYELSGFDLDMRLAEIDHEDPTKLELARLDVKLKHNQITSYEYDVQYNTVRLKDDALLPEVLLDLELKHHRISKLEHDRKLADLRSEPWVNMPDIKWDPSDPSRSYFELDYNEHFVSFLRNNGYKGVSDDQVVESWLTEVCRAVALDLAQEDPAFVSDAVAPVQRKRQPRKKKTEYS